MTAALRPARRGSAGFTMIEMMVSLLVGMVVILAVVAVQKTFEGQRRTSTSGNDLDNAGAYVLNQLDGMMRSAGSGFTQAYTQTYGCQLNVAAGGTTYLPPPAALPAPFDTTLAAMGGTVRMAPVLIMPGATATTQLDGGTGGGGSSDVLMVMSGAGYAANLQTAFTGPPTSTSLTVASTAAFNANDLVLLMDAVAPNGPASCAIEQVASTFAGGAGVTALPLGGTYYSTSPYSPGSFSVDGAVVGIGNTAKGNYPAFELLGVGSGNQLYAYDLLNFQGTQLLPIGDSVMELHAVYLTTAAGGNGFVGVAPSGNFAPATLMNGTSTAAGNLNSIKAVRVGLILKSPLLEKIPQGGGHVGPSQLQLFSTLSDANGNSLTYTRTLSTNNCSATAPAVNCELDYRYRTMEITIPLRNPLLY